MFQMSKKKNKDLSKVSLDEREFEIQKADCTFKPQINKNIGADLSQTLFTPILSHRSNAVNRTLTSIESDSQRRMSAYNEKRYIQSCKESGKFPQNNKSFNTEYSRSEKRQKINESIERLYGKRS